jgi:hypothetical protein
LDYLNKANDLDNRSKNKQELLNEIEHMICTLSDFMNEIHELSNGFTKNSMIFRIMDMIHPFLNVIHSNADIYSARRLMLTIKSKFHQFIVHNKQYHLIPAYNRTFADHVYDNLLVNW